jgi:hypothetical protein
VVSARHAGAHELRGELAHFWGARSGLDGVRSAKLVDQYTLHRCFALSNWTDRNPHWSTTDECMGSAAFQFVLCSNRLHDLNRDDHSPIDGLAQPRQTPTKAGVSRHAFTIPAGFEVRPVLQIFIIATARPLALQQQLSIQSPHRRARATTVGS